MTRACLRSLAGWGFSVAAAWLLAGCGGEVPETAVATAVAPEAGELQKSPPQTLRPINDRARLLAGLPANPASPYAALQRSLGSAYETHANEYWEDWRAFSYHRLEPMRSWSAQWLGTVGGTVFYPFSGPDVLNVLALFPHARQVIMVGLEPAGAFTQDPTQLLPGVTLDALARFRRSTHTLLDASYFVTKDMKVDFSSPPFVGVSPVMQGLLALGGYEILEASESRIAGVPAARVRVARLGTGMVQEVIYLQGDLSDGGSAAMLDWVKAQGPRAVYLKAASYLMHEPGFARIRRFVLEVPGPIVQDDSGVPFAALQGAGRRIQLFGEYRGTLDIFTKYHQADMAAAYGQVQAPKLDFSTGYSVRFDKSNLQVAWPRGSGPGAAATVPNLAPSGPVPAPPAALLPPRPAPQPPAGVSLQQEAVYRPLGAPVSAAPQAEPVTRGYEDAFEPEPAW